MKFLTQFCFFAGIDVNCIAPVALYSLFEGIEDDRSDPSNINQKQITVAHEIRKIFLVFLLRPLHALFDVASWLGYQRIFCSSIACSLTD